MKPVIGLSSYAAPARWANWHAPAAVLPFSYTSQVAAAGGIPVLLPPVPGIAAAVGRLDGLVLTGGGDDRAELDLLTAALAARLPVLGICRGLQLLNIARGGTMHQGGTVHQDLPQGPGASGSHPVRVAAGSMLAAIVPAGRPFTVPAARHQAIDRLGDGLTATAWSADGVIEAAELTGAGHHPFVLAVQWHPEEDDDPRLFQALVAAAHGTPVSERGPRGRSGEGEQEEGHASRAEQGERG